MIFCFEITFSTKDIVNKALAADFVKHPKKQIISNIRCFLKEFRLYFYLLILYFNNIFNHERKTFQHPQVSYYRQNS